MSSRPYLTKEQKGEMYKLAMEGNSLGMIGDAVGCSVNSISGWLRRWGIQNAAAGERHKRTKSYANKKEREAVVVEHVGPPVGSPDYKLTVGRPDRYLARLRSGLR